jgi:hypothetical protein
VFFQFLVAQVLAVVFSAIALARATSPQRLEKVLAWIGLSLGVLYLVVAAVRPLL